MLARFALATDQRDGALGAGADPGVYKTVLQVLDLDALPLSTASDRQAPPAAPGDKAREYPHSSGDRNTFPPTRHPDKGTQRGGSQRVAPTDLPAARTPDRRRTG